MAALAFLIGTLGLTLPQAPRTTAIYNRRATLSVPLGLAALNFAPRQAQAAVPPCPKGANNCLSTAAPSNVGTLKPWKFPSGMSKTDAIESLHSVLEAYPKQGQNGVDLGGWKFVDDSLSSTGTAKLEYMSGVGSFAKFFNGGKPFVDDLVVSVEDGAVAVRSSSRVGDSDLGVNAKRLNYIAAALREKGWDAPNVA